MRVLLFGSGAFGLPTFEALAASCEVVGVVSQPDRPAGRRRHPTPTPISMFALDARLALHRPENINDDSVIESLHALDADAWVVIAYGQKLSGALLEGQFAINLHGSVLPRWRGAAPIHRAMLAGDRETGVSVIALADRMDAGEVYATRSTPIGPTDTAGEVHDRLAALGPEVIECVLQQLGQGALDPQAQDEDQVTHAAKMSRDDAMLSLDMTADEMRRTINGCSPWPGCTARIGDVQMRLLKADMAGSDTATRLEPGQMNEHGVMTTAEGVVRVLEVQPAGGRAMPLGDWANGQRWAWPARVDLDP